MCGPDNVENICPLHWIYSKCSADIPTEHQECYDSGSVSNNREYDCLARGDETNEETSSEETIDFESITPCITTDPSPNNGLMCGSECIAIYFWCTPNVYTQSCTTNTSRFNTNNPTLCQNTNFWQNISCDTEPNDAWREAGHRCKVTSSALLLSRLNRLATQEVCRLFRSNCLCPGILFQRY